MQKISTFLMFVGDQHGRAEEAMTFYTSVLEDARVLGIERWGPGEDEPEGTVKQARFSLAGREFIAMDSGQAHAFTFTPAISLFVEFDAEPQLDDAYAKLSDGAAVLMPLQQYPFSPKLVWLQDRYGVSWQLNLLVREPAVT